MYASLGVVFFLAQRLFCRGWCVCCLVCVDPSTHLPMPFACMCGVRIDIRSTSACTEAAGLSHSAGCSFGLLTCAMQRANTLTG